MSENQLEPWNEQQKLGWLTSQTIKRSYHDNVLTRLHPFKQRSSYSVEQYGALTYSPDQYPLYAVKVGQWTPTKRNILVTGGVHGYETSGVHGALQFLDQEAQKYSNYFNILVVPCVSPWSYETINRLNTKLQNPNREFKESTTCDETKFLIAYLRSLSVDFHLHLDLHETTDTDKTTFIPMEWAMKGIAHNADTMIIPDGFHLIHPQGKSRPALEKRIIDYVLKVTHIAEPDPGSDPSKPTISEADSTSPGVVECPTGHRFCYETTSAQDNLGAFTTEVYPDSQRLVAAMSREEIDQVCNNAQVAVVKAALDFYIETLNLK